MSQYIPTHTIEATSGNIKNFVSEHDKYIWKIWLPMIVPYLIIDYALDYLVFLNFRDDGVDLYNMMILVFLANLFNTAFIALIAINWHRLVIKGRDDFKLMNPLKPTKNELWFIWLAIILTTIQFLLSILVDEAAISFIQLTGMFVFLIKLSIVIFLSYLLYRISFVFPAKAVGVDLKFSDSWRQSQGTFWAITFSTFLASLNLAGMFIIFLVIMIIVTFVLPNSVLWIVSYVDDLVLLLYFFPRFVVIGVTALSNYYMYAMEQEEKEQT